jgi:hypothetical protein
MRTPAACSTNIGGIIPLFSRKIPLFLGAGKFCRPPENACFSASKNAENAAKRAFACIFRCRQGTPPKAADDLAAPAAGMASRCRRLATMPCPSSGLAAKSPTPQAAEFQPGRDAPPVSDALWKAFGDPADPWVLGRRAGGFCRRGCGPVGDHSARLAAGQAERLTFKPRASGGVCRSAGRDRHRTERRSNARRGARVR